MERIAERITNYIYHSGAIEKDDYELYKYGFQSGLEMSFCVAICFLIAAVINSLYEEVLFWVLFFGIRSYAGGIHMKKYSSCIICSCLVNTGILLLNKYFIIQKDMAFFLILLFFLFILTASFREFKRKETAVDEMKYYLKKLRIKAGLLLFMSIFGEMFSWERSLSLAAYTLAAIAISMVLSGILKNQKRGRVLPF